MRFVGEEVDDQERRPLDRAALVTANVRLSAAITITVLLWGSAFVGIRSALPALAFANLAAGRLALAAPTFLVLSRHFAGYQLLLSAGEQTVPASTSALIFSFAPLMAVALARPVLAELVSHLLGGLLVLTGVVLYALWIVLQKRALRTLPPFTVTAWATWFGALFALPFGIGLPHAVATAPPGALLTLFASGVITTTVPFLLWTWTVSQLDASKAAPLLLLIAPATLLVGFVWLGEVPGVMAVIGGAVTIAGVASNTTLGSSLLHRTGARRSVRTPTRGLSRGRAATLPS